MKRHTVIEKVILLGFCLSGAAALTYEVVWTRALSLVMGSTTYAMSTMLASFMAGLTLGGYIGGLWADRAKNPAFVFGILEGGIAIFGVLTFIVIKNLSPVYAWIFYTFHLSFSAFSFAQFILSFLVMLIPTTLMGATFPMVLKARAKDPDKIGRESGNVYSVNNLGAIAGSVAAGFFLIPLVGIKAANLTAAILNFIVAIGVIYLSGMSFKIWALRITIVMILVSAIAFFIRYPAAVFRFYVANRYPSYSAFEMSKINKSLIFEKDGVQGLVQVFRDEVNNIFLLINDGKIEGTVARAGTRIEARTERDWVNQLLLAYLPLEANPGMKSFLNIGLGTGTTLRAAISDPALARIDCVEINPVVLEAVERYFYPELFVDPRVGFIAADARNYLMLVDNKYDVISSEPSYPVSQGIGNLFSLEFFDIVKSRLSGRGVFAQWLPGYLLSNDDKMVMIKTFGVVFPFTYVWEVMGGGDIILLGSDAPIRSSEELPERIERREKAQGIRQNYRLWLDPEDVRRIVKQGGPLNTDDRPLLEFAAARNMLI